MTPKTDIVVPLFANRDRPAETFFQKCISDVEQNTRNYRLILVDDGCDDQARNVMEEVSRKHKCLLIHSGRQRWFTKAVNLGLRMVRTPQVVVLNADTELNSGWLEELYSVWTEAEQTEGRVGLVGDVHSDPEPRRWARSVGQDYVTGHCWLLSMQAISEASAARGTPGLYLDETKAGCIHIRSDVEICWDLNRLGWATIKSFKAPIGHHGGKSWGHLLGTIPSRLSDVDYEYQNEG